MVERFDCKTLCSSRGQFVDDQRARRGCSRPDLPPVAWRVDPKAIHRGGPMGRLPIVATMTPTARFPGGSAYQSGIQVSADQPPEDPDEGCPAGWYWSAFVQSVRPYLRRRDQQGNRVANLLLDRVEDDLIFALVAYLEDEQERWESYRWETLNPD